MEEMSIEEAINILKHIKLGKKADTKAPNKVVAEKAKISVIAIEKVLSELDRRIAPEVIEEKIQEHGAIYEKWLKQKEYEQCDIQSYKIDAFRELLNKK